MQDTVGIDVSKATLDAYWLSGRQHQVFSNDPSGLKRLLRWIFKAKAALTVFEATGVCDRPLQAQLAAHGVPFARINPKQARRFAEGIGQLAKTDKVDAAVLARMGSLLDLEAETPRAQNAHDLKDLATARQALIKDRTAAKARAQTATVPLLKAQFTKRLKQIERDLVQVDAAILSVIAPDERLSDSAEILTSIPGIATVTACAMLTKMPELGTIWGKQAASVAGSAPPLGPLRRNALPGNACPVIWDLAGARAHSRSHSRWSRRNAAIPVFAGSGRNTLQPRHDGEV